MLSTSSSKSSVFSSSVLSRGDPVNSGISSDCLVLGVNENDFVELEGSVLTNPVAVENSKVRCLSSNSLLSNSLVRSGGLKLVDTLVDWLSVDDSLGDWSLSATSSDSDSVDNVSLLGLVTELSGLIDSAWSVDLVDDGKLSVFPRSHSEDESEHIRLFLSPKLFEVLVGSHIFNI